MPPQAQGLPCCPHGHGLAASRLGGNRGSCCCSRRDAGMWGGLALLPGAVPCHALARSIPTAVSLCLSRLWSVRLSVSLCEEPSGRWQSPQPPINLLESSSGGGQEGTGKGGTVLAPRQGQSAAGAGPQGSATAAATPPAVPTPGAPHQHHNSLYKTNHIYCTAEHRLNVSDFGAPGASAGPGAPACTRAGGSARAAGASTAPHRRGALASAPQPNPGTHKRSHRPPCTSSDQTA